MRMMTKILTGAASVATMAAAAPAAAQYYAYPTYNQYSYAQPYSYMNTNVAASQCTAAVQSRLYNRASIGGILGVLLSANTPSGRVLSITQVSPRSNGLIRVRGLASSGRYAYNGYGPYGVGAYGALGYNYANAADLSFRCDVAPNGAVYRVNINRR